MWQSWQGIFTFTEISMKRLLNFSTINMKCPNLYFRKKYGIKMNEVYQSLEKNTVSTDAPLTQSPG